MSDVTVRAIGNGTTVLPSTAESVSQSVSLRIAAPTRIDRSIQLAVVLLYVGATVASILRPQYTAPSVYEVLVVPERA